MSGSKYRTWFASVRARRLFAWRRHFCESTVLRPNHGAGSETRVTRRDAAEYITEHADEWQAAMQALLLVAEQDGPAMFARTDVMKALNRHVERVFNPS